jgi:hypothetical protein
MLPDDFCGDLDPRRRPVGKSVLVREQDRFSFSDIGGHIAVPPVAADEHRDATSVIESAAPVEVHEQPTHGRIVPRASALGSAASRLAVVIACVGDVRRRGEGRDRRRADSL